MLLGRFWNTFISLLPRTARQTGKIEINLGDGRYVVRLVGGGMVIARSEVAYAEGEPVFVAGEKIEGKAKNLTQVVIEV